MAKVKYDDITFDSDLEVNYYKHLMEKKVVFKYHLPYPIELDFMDKGYTPDFIEFYPVWESDMFDCVIVETKGYNQFSARMDTVIHKTMNKIVATRNDMLRKWLAKNGVTVEYVRNITYQKTKYLKAHGFVDFSFKPPGHKDAWKNRATAAEEELKITKSNLKKALRLIVIANKPKLNKTERTRGEILKKEMFELINKKD